MSTTVPCSNLYHSNSSKKIILEILGLVLFCNENLKECKGSEEGNFFYNFIDEVELVDVVKVFKPQLVKDSTYL